MEISFLDNDPDTKKACFVAGDADIIGEVVLGKDSTVWFKSTLRGDVSGIFIGERTNIQDNCVIHGETGVPTIIGNDVTVGHGAILHGCTIGNCCLIGMGAIIMSRAEIGDGCIIGAGTVITEDKKIPPRSIVMGLPGKTVRKTTDEQIEFMLKRAEKYVNTGKIYKSESALKD